MSDFFTIGQEPMRTNSASRKTPSRPRADDPSLTEPQGPEPRALLDASYNIAEYVAQMTAELAGLSSNARLDMLTYFLNMARIEAEACLRNKNRIT
jgi:hypothetical protein